MRLGDADATYGSAVVVAVVLVAVFDFFFFFRALFFASQAQLEQKEGAEKKKKEPQKHASRSPIGLRCWFSSQPRKATREVACAAPPACASVPPAPATSSTLVGCTIRCMCPYKRMYLPPLVHSCSALLPDTSRPWLLNLSSPPSLLHSHRVEPFFTS